MAGGKGGSTTSEVKVPEYIEAAAQRNLNRADKVSQLGYVPEYGPTVAAFTPNQQAAFQNTANTADAFGMSSPTSQQDIMGGMAPPTTYANGVQGYSSAPMYEQMVNELAQNRPGQKSYIDSFFIDPSSGDYARQPTDYTQYNTMAQDARNEASAGRSESAAQRANDLAVARASAPVTYNTSNTSMSTPLSYAPGGVNDPFLTSGPSQFIAGKTGIPGMTKDDNNVYTRPSGAVTSSPRPVARPTSPGAGGIVSGGGSDGVGNFGAVGDFFGGVGDAIGVTDYASKSAKPAVKPAVKPAAKPTSTSKKGCVVATHAVESGAFTPHMKREAVMWCMDVLHGKWWGEAIRRGYRYCGTKKIEQGKAREHYSEFRRYIDFASGKKRTLRGAVTFTLRTAQFFAVGLVKRDA